MMNAIKFVSRTPVGAVQNGSVGGEGQGFLIDASAGQDISLNISQSDVRGYDRAADDLLITLADGRVIVLEGFFDDSSGRDGTLFLSSNGVLNEVGFVEAEGGALFAQYGPAEVWGKWSPSDALIFLDEPTVVAEAAAVAASEGSEVSMLAAGLLGLGGIGAAGLGAAALGGAAALIGGGDNDGGNGDTDEAPWVPPTVDDPEASYVISGGDTPVLTVSGTANPGSVVEVTIDGVTMTGVAGDDRTWEVVFDGDNFPADGDYGDVTVVVTDLDGTVSSLDGPSFVIDTTPPPIDVSAGTITTGDLVNAADHADGVTISGQGESGSTMTITVGEASQTTTVGEDGSWSFTFDETVFPDGEYTTEITLTSTDAFGNSTTVVDTVEVDTVNTVSLDNAPLTGDDVISQTEADAGVSFVGTTQAGASVAVTINGVTHTAIADDAGAWTVTFVGGDLIDGTYETTAVIISTDPAGNASEISHTFTIDTEVGVTINTADLEGDGVINAVEADDGITVTGTAEGGASVVVSTNGSSVTTTADGTGGWSVDIPSVSVPRGTLDMEITATATDGAGNTVTATGTVGVDTEISLTIDTSTLAVDGIINSTEHAGMVDFTGTGEPGATVTLELYGESVSAIVGADGNWTMPFPASVLPTNAGQVDSISVLATVTSTDAAGNMALASGGFEIDVTNHVEIYTSSVEGDGVVNAAERVDGVVLTGYTDAVLAGSTVVVTVNGNDYDATIAFDGNWSVTLPVSEIPEGDTTLDVIATSTDAAGNVSTATGTMNIDTVTNVAVMTAGVEGDGVINASEASDGATLTGTAEAGASVVVEANGGSYTTTADASGSWSVDIPATGLPSGTLDMVITATATDAAGNVATATGTVGIDTEIALTIDTSALAVDGIINSTEHAGMVDFTGTGEPGATVTLELYGETAQAVVGADGNWTMPFPASVLPTNAGQVDSIAVLATVTSTDAAGNMALASGGFEIDVTNHVEIYTSSVEGDGVVNAAERADGVVLTGYTDATGAGSTVVVTVNGNSYDATIAADGNWSVMLPASEIPEGDTTLDVMATSTDAAGNVSTASGTMDIDTTTNVAVRTAGVETDGVVNAAERADGVTLTGTTEPGSTVMVTMGTVTHVATVAADGSWSAGFSAAELPTGERVLDVTARATDAAGNEATATGTVDLDTLVRNFAITSTPGEADGLINSTEAAQGLTLTGTTEPGGTVAITLEGQTVQAVVDAGGNWTAVFAAGQLPSGEKTVTLTAVSKDPAGNSETITQLVTIDTDAGLLTISPDPVETDDVVNLVEASNGVTLKGTSNPDQVVEVTLNGVTHAVVTDPSGTWTVDYAPGEIAPGTYTADISAMITDSAGNTLTRTDSVQIDTEVLNFAASTDLVEGDNVINANEASDGFTLTGTTEPGGSVDVTFDGTTHSATVDANGNWTVSFAANDVPSGELAGLAQIDTVDAAGNTATTSVSFDIDTLVNTLAMSSDPVTADDVINAAEARQGVTLNGQVETGSTVSVTVGGVIHVATVDAAGNWSVDIPPDAMPTGTQQAPVLIEAMDAAGNTRSVTEMLSVDTDAPDSLGWLGYGRDGAGVDLIRTEITEDSVYLGQLTQTAGEAGVVDVSIDATTDIDVIGQSYIDLTGSVADGTHLVLTATDAAGNTSGSYLVTDDPATNTVLMSDDIASALSDFQIDTIDLHFAEDSSLTITEAQIKALSDNTDTVTIRGGRDDSITIHGAQDQGTQTVDDDGNAFNVFSLGDATLLIEDDITSIHGVT